MYLLNKYTNYRIENGKITIKCSFALIMHNNIRYVYYISYLHDTQSRPEVKGYLLRFLYILNSVD